MKKYTECLRLSKHSNEWERERRRTAMNEWINCDGDRSETCKEIQNQRVESVERKGRKIDDLKFK